MKAHQHQSNASGTGANTKSGSDKIQSLKASAHINKSSGDVLALSILCLLWHAQLSTEIVI
jgi:hypothetical protein